jgi:hypothetical protein
MTPSPGTIGRKAAAILRALRGRIRHNGQCSHFESGKRAVRICEIFITDDKDIYSYTSGAVKVRSRVLIHVIHDTGGTLGRQV